jgi:hypothetical protein
MHACSTSICGPIMTKRSLIDGVCLSG